MELARLIECLSDPRAYLEAAQRWELIGPQTGRNSHEIDTHQDDAPPLAQALKILERIGVWGS